jgi:hypothetical protein
MCQKNEERRFLCEVTVLLFDKERIEGGRKILSQELISFSAPSSSDISPVVVHFTQDKRQGMITRVRHLINSHRVLRQNQLRA